MLTLQEKLFIIDNSSSLLELNKEVLPEVHKENYYFVSYSHKDYKKVMKDILLLEEQGINIWYDSDMHIGENWEELAEMYISKYQCKGIIFYLSENSILSKACNKEVEYVLENNKQFFSINIPLDLPDSNNNIDMSGLDMLLKLKELGKGVDDNLIGNFKKAFPNNYLYLSYNDSIERKKEQIEKLVGEDLLDFKSYYSIDTDQNSCKLVRCRDNSLVSINLKTNNLVNIKTDKNFGKYFPLESIDQCIFANLFKLAKVTLPQTIIEIDDFAFKNCYNLKSINLDNDLVHINNYAFANCESLELDKINCRFIKKYAFHNCISLKNLEIYAHEIGDYAFSNCKNLETVKLTRETITIDYLAFSYNDSLREISLNSDEPNVLNSYKGLRLNNGVFQYCNKLEHFKLLGKVHLKEASGLFTSCKGLKTVTLDITTNKIIPRTMFYLCDELQEVIGIEKFKKIGDLAFAYCYKYNNGKLINAKEIGEKSFYETAITELDLPNVEKIDFGAFALCTNLTKVSIGKKIKSLGENIFYDSINIKELEILGSDIELEYNTFSTINPEIITLCDLNVLDYLIDDNMFDLKTLYIKKDLISLEDLNEKQDMFKKAISDKDGFDKFIVEVVNPYAKFKNKHVIIELYTEERIYSLCEKVGFDEERNEYYVETFDRYYESEIKSIEIDLYY